MRVTDHGDRDVGAPRRDNQSGLTLIELMVAFAVLAIILAATAASLITFTRAAHTNERRVQATALINRLHEDFQSIPWELGGNYAGELAPLGDLSDPDGNPLFEPGDPGAADPADRLPRFEGRQVVALADPDNTGCPGGNPECNRDPEVPPVYSDTSEPGSLYITNDGNTYEIYQVATWIDRSGDGIEDVKRFTTIVRWEILGRTLEERADSERAPTAIEAGDPTGTQVWFDAGPRRTNLDDDDRNGRPLRFYARFNDPVVTATVSFYVVESVTDSVASLGERTVSLSPGVAWPTGGYIDFDGSVDALTHRFTTGPRRFRLSAVTPTGTVITAERSIDMIREDGLEWVPDPGQDAPPDDDDPDGDPGGGGGNGPEVVIDSVSVNRSFVKMAGNGRFTCDLVISAIVSGLTPDSYNVTADYFVGTALRRTVDLEPVGGAATLSPTNQLFRWTFTEGMDWGFEETTGRFSINAERFSTDEVDGAADGPRLTSPVKFGKGGSACS